MSILLDVKIALQAGVQHVDASVSARIGVAVNFGHKEKNKLA
jgi:hypothetical protein